MHPAQDEDFGRLLAAIQKRTGLSDQAIAEVAGVNRSQVWRWTHSGSAPGYEPVRRLAAWLADERPEVAEQAGALLSAAGYEALPAPDPPDIDWPIPPQEGTPFTIESLAAAGEFAYEAFGRLRDLRTEGIDRPTGDQVYPLDARAAGGYDTALAAGYSPAAAIEVVATVQATAERVYREQHRDRRSGTRGALAAGERWSLVSPARTEVTDGSLRVTRRSRSLWV